MSSETSQRWRAERAVKRSRESKRELKALDKQKELEKQALANKGQLDVQRLSNEGTMAVTQLKEEGDWGRHKSDIDWRTGDAARTFDQREGQFERGFQQTQSIADRNADFWLKGHEENIRQFDVNRWDKGIEKRLEANVDPVTGEIRPNAIGYDQAAADTTRIQSLYGKSPGEIDASRQGMMVSDLINQYNSLGSKKERDRLLKGLPASTLALLKGRSDFLYNPEAARSVPSPTETVEQTKTYRMPFSDAVNTGRGKGATGLMGDQDDKGFWKRGKTLM